MRIGSLIASMAFVLFTGAVVVQKPLGPNPVVVELFTSQGCSSCPPAEELIRGLAHDPSLRGKVIPLAFHVDYWNRLGWRDPFSSPDWSRRQMFYVRAMRLESAYTPQAVVNGSREFAGSNSLALRGALEEASRRAPVGSVRLEVSRDGATITAAVRSEAPAGTDVMIALFENDVTTHIGAGENEGRTQTEDAIVRQLLRVGSGSVDMAVSLTADPSWKQAGVAVFLQDHHTLSIGNAAVRYLP